MKIIRKLIGVQTNHDVEYFGGPAAPTHRFSYNQSKESNAENLVKIAWELSVLEPI